MFALPALEPLGLLRGGGRGTAGIRGGYSRRKAHGRMDSRRAAVLLLLLLPDWGCAQGPGGQDEGHQIFVVSDHPIPVLPFFSLSLKLVFPSSGTWAAGVFTGSSYLRR